MPCSLYSLQCTLITHDTTVKDKTRTWEERSALQCACQQALQVGQQPSHSKTLQSSAVVTRFQPSSSSKTSLNESLNLMLLVDTISHKLCRHHPVLLAHLAQHFPHWGGCSAAFVQEVPFSRSLQSSLNNTAFHHVPIACLHAMLETLVASSITST